MIQMQKRCKENPDCVKVIQRIRPYVLKQATGPPIKKEECPLFRSVHEFIMGPHS